MAKYILRFTGSGEKPAADVKSIRKRAGVTILDEAPRMQRPAYMVYPEVARFRETLDLALTGLREIARQWEPR